MAYRVFHIFSKPADPEDVVAYKPSSSFVKNILLKLGLLKETKQASPSLSFAHSVVSPLELQKVIKEQMTLLRLNKLEPFCIFIGSRDYSDLCEYADIHLIQQVSHIDTIQLFEEFTKTLPLSKEHAINAKMLDLVQHETSALHNRQIHRLPGSLIVSGYKFLNLPIIILPWLGGVFVAPSLATPPNTTLI